MIETKERWEHIRDSDYFTSIYWDMVQELIGTIEALREVARAADFARGRLALLGHKPSSDAGMAFSTLDDAVEALPDWLVE